MFSVSPILCAASVDKNTEKTKVNISDNDSNSAKSRTRPPVFQKPDWNKSAKISESKYRRAEL